MTGLATGRSSGPLYRQVEAVLRSQIRSGQHSVGSILPTENELARRFGVSRATVRNALQKLSTDGFVHAKSGVGTQVIRAQGTARTSELRGLTEDLRARGIATKARTLQSSLVVPPPSIAAKLKLREDERALQLTRLREVAGTPFALLNAYVPESIGIAPDQDFSGPLYELIEKAYNLHITYGEDVIGARLPTLREAELLQTGPGAPVLTMRRTAYTEFDRPIEYVEAAIRADLYEHHVTLSRKKAKANADSER